jgi:hypothetical protein
MKNDEKKQAQKLKLRAPAKGRRRTRQNGGAKAEEESLRIQAAVQAALLEAQAPVIDRLAGRALYDTSLASRLVDTAAGIAKCKKRRSLTINLRRHILGIPRIDLQDLAKMILVRAEELSKKPRGCRSAARSGCAEKAETPQQG